MKTQTRLFLVFVFFSVALCQDEDDAGYTPPVSRQEDKVVVSDPALKKLRIGDPFSYLGTAEDLARAMKARPALPAAQLAEDAVAVKRGMKPSWAGPEPAGLIGAGPPKQKQFWDKEFRVWRNGPGSFDPLTGEDLSGRVVPPSGFSKRSTVDICKLGPAFCTGPRPAFCRVDPKLCTALNGKEIPGLEGMPRARMPQASLKDETRFLSFLGSGSPVNFTRSTINPAALTPTQGEIGVNAVAERGDKMGGTESRVIWLSKDLYIVDGHHSWAGSRWARQTGVPQVNIQANIIDMPISDILRKALTALEPAPGGGFVKQPDGTFKSTETDLVTFQNMLAVDSQRGAKNSWKTATRQRLHDAGMDMPEEDLDRYFDALHSERK